MDMKWWEVPFLDNNSPWGGLEHLVWNFTKIGFLQMKLLRKRTFHHKSGETDMDPWWCVPQIINASTIQLSNNVTIKSTHATSQQCYLHVHLSDLDLPDQVAFQFSNTSQDFSFLFVPVQVYDSEIRSSRSTLQIQAKDCTLGDKEHTS